MMLMEVVLNTLRKISAAHFAARRIDASIYTKWPPLPVAFCLAKHHDDDVG